MSCNITADNHIVLQKIKEMVGTNDTLCAAYVTAISTASGFKADFAATLKNRMEIDVNNPQESDIPYIMDYVTAQMPAQMLRNYIILSVQPGRTASSCLFNNSSLVICSNNVSYTPF